MSSHHFVKEDQEPALIIIDASSVSFALVQELLEWSPTVIVLEQAMESVLRWGIKIDVVISSQEKVPQYVDVLKEQTPVKILSYQSDERPLTTAFYFLLAGKYRAVNVVGIDLELLKPYTEYLDVVAFIDQMRWSFARNGKFEKWLPSASKIVVRDEGTPISKVGLDEHNRVIGDGVVSLISRKPFWVGEAL
jgi:hypothetical protein